MWPLVIVLQLLALEPPQPFELGQDTAQLTLITPGEADLLRRVSAVVADPAENLLLRLGRVESDEEPGASWEVYVASADPGDCDNVPALAGILSLYGAMPGAEFVLPLDLALAAGKPIGIRLLFKPVSGLVVNGQPVPASVRSTVRIGAISLETEGPDRPGP